MNPHTWRLTRLRSGSRLVRTTVALLLAATALAIAAPGPAGASAVTAGAATTAGHNSRFTWAVLIMGALVLVVLAALYGRAMAGRLVALLRRPGRASSLPPSASRR